MLMRKIWCGLGVVALSAGTAVAQSGEAGEAGEGGEAGTPAAVAAEHYFGATHKPDYPFATALKKVLAGENGEGGIGFSSGGKQFVINALTDKQLKAALVGNTVRKDQAVALYFGADGKVTGWKRDWAKADMKECPTALGDNYEIEHGICYTATVNPIVGPYEIKNGTVCMPAYSGKAADGRGCYYLGFMGKYVIIGDGNRMYGSGKDLVPGKELAAFQPHLH